MKKVLFLLFFALITNISYSSTFEITISNPQYKPIKVGLWGFVKNTPEIVSKRLINTMKRDLDMSGIFIPDVSQHFSYEARENVVNGIARLDNIDYVIYGNAVLEGKNIYVNLKITDVLKNTVVIDRTFSSDKYSLNWVADKIVDLLIGYVTGSYGPFESKIVFALGNGKTSDIYICDFNGQNVVRITNWHTFNMLPKWVDSDEITFLSYRYGKPAVFLFNIFSGRLIKLFNASNLSIAAVRYMNNFAISFNRFGSTNIYIINQKGRVLRKLTNNPYINVSPSFTPDFSKMVFVSNRDGNPQIYMKDLNTMSDAKRLTFQGKYNSSPDISPDGKKIAYISLDNGVSYLKIMNIDSSNDKALMEGYSLDSPCWSYDSRYIVLTGRIGNKNVIYIVNTNNGHVSVAMETKLIYNGLSVSSKLQ